VREIEALRTVIAEVLDKLPASLRSNPQVQKLEEISRRGAVSLIHLVNRRDTKSSVFKDFEFSRATVDELWQAGHGDVQRVLNHPESCRVSEVGNGVRIFDL
jgi:NTE family protein